MWFLFLIIPLLSFADQMLWQRNAVSLIEENGFCAISIDRSLSEMEDQEIIEFERTVAKMQDVFQEVFGFGDFIRWMPLGTKRLTSYCIPVGAYVDGNALDYDFKVRVMLYTLRDKKVLLPPLSGEKIDTIRQIAMQILPKDIQCIPLVDANFSFERIREGICLALNDLDLPCDIPQETHFPFELSFTTNCKAFCNSNVLTKQKIAQTEWNHLLYNYRPYVDCHLMIIPIQHRAFLSELSHEEILDKWKLFAKIEKIALETSPKVAVLTRTGWLAGQTQSHQHDHILAFDPKQDQYWLHNWVQELQGNLLPIDAEKWESIRLFWQESQVDALPSRPN